VKVLVLAIAALVLSGCTDVVKLRNPTTGETAQCGPYQLEGLGQPASVAQREARCLDDYQRQGFVRAP
jgi:uncharacterized protein YceK